MQHSAKAASFSMQTGYYMGSGVSGKTISGLGFQPQLVLIKGSNSTQVSVFKTSAMPAANSSFLSAAADNTASSITFTSGGFSLGTLANSNTVNVLYTWSAFAGSDCTSTGTFCVGTYTGNGVATRAITTGFQPTIVIAKRSTAIGGHFRTASMAANRTEYFTSTAADTAGAYIASFAATGFNVGAQDNVSAGVYYYIAFKSAAGIAAEGTYSGDGTDNRSITAPGFQSNLVMIKNSTSVTVNNRRAMLSSDQHNGDDAGYVADGVVNAVNFIQQVNATGFQLGSGVNTNELAATMYWFALGGAPAMSGGSGSFTMAAGTYTGTGVAASVTSVGFMPDLVIIKDNAANYMVFRTSQMQGDITAYLASATADFAGGITSLTANGFTVGTSLSVNSSGNTYQWQAFGNAYEPDTKTGAADFAVGEYYGTGIDSKQITATPYQMDFVTAKGSGATAAAFRSSSQTGDLSGFFTGTAEAANTIQVLNSTGFEVGTNLVNTSTALVRWFGFKTGTNFNVGSYTGNGVVDRSVVVQANSTPDLVWIKQASTSTGTVRPSTLSGDISQFFTNTVNVGGRIKTLVNGGFTVGTTAEVNTNAAIYRYMAWRVPLNGVLSSDVVSSTGTTVASPIYAMNTIAYPFNCSESTGVLGDTNQRLRLSNTTASALWTLSIAATDGTTALWQNSGNTKQFDFNDPVGCSDGADADTKAGKLRMIPSSATLTPQSGCSNTNVALGTDQTFSEGSVNSITLMSTSTGAATGCYWDLTNVEVRQTIPAEQANDGYNINLTLTATAS